MEDQNKSDLALSDANPSGGVDSKFQCIHSSAGCTFNFDTEKAQRLHSNLCKFGIVRWCQYPNCIKSECGLENDLVRLVEHAKSKHGCLSIVGFDQRESYIPITINADIWKGHSKRYSSELVATYEIEKQGSKFKMVIITYVDKDSNGATRLYVIPMQCNDRNRPNYFMRVKMTLLGNNGKKVIKCHGDLPHSSHKLNDGLQVVFGAIRSNSQLFDAIKNVAVPNYILEDLFQDYSGDTDAPLNLTLMICVDVLRCHIYDDLAVMEKAEGTFQLTWDELDVNEASRKTLSLEYAFNKKYLPSPASCIILPRLSAASNYVIGSKDPMVVLYHLLGVVSTRKNKDEPKEPWETKDTRLIVIFPDHFMLFSATAKIVDKAYSVGLCTKTLFIKERFYWDLNEDGADVVLTTPSILLDILKNTPSVLQLVLLPKLKYILIPNLDCIQDEETIGEVKACVQLLAYHAFRQALTYIASGPVINHETMAVLEKCIFFSQRNFKLIYVGPQPDSFISSSNAVEWKTPSLTHKFGKILEIIFSHEESKRILIVSSEQVLQYKARMDKLATGLRKTFPHRRNCIMRVDQNNRYEANSFDRFKDLPGAILLSSFYCIHYDAVKTCDVIIVVAWQPVSKPLKMRLVTLAEKFDGTMKQISYLTD